MDSNYFQTLEYMELHLALTRILCAAILWGIHLCLSVHACGILLKRNLSSSAAGCWQLGLVLIMLGLSTGHLVHLLNMESAKWYVYEVTDFVWNTISTIIFLINDFIVIWRAWVLWPGNIYVKGTLGVIFAFSIACAGRNIKGFVGDPPLLAIMLGSFPFMLSNLVATTLVAYKAWLYRSELQVFLNHSGGITSSGSVSRKLGRVFLLLIESGVVYIIFWAIYVASFLTPAASVVAGNLNTSAFTTIFKFRQIWEVIMAESSAMYPTIIIILVSSLMSQSDVVNGTYSTTQRNTAPTIDQNQPNAVQRNAEEDISNLHFAHRSISDSRGDVSTVMFQEHEKNSSHGENGELKAAHSIV